MGMFHDLDIANAADDPGSIPSDWYDLIVADVKENQTSKKAGNENKKFTVFVFAIDGGYYDGRELQDWKWVPEPYDESPEAKDALAYIKQRLTQLGVPLSRMSTVEPNDLKGIQLRGELVKNGQYTNIAFGENALKLRGGPDGEPSLDGLNEFLPS